MINLKYKIVAVDFDMTLTFNDKYPESGDMNLQAVSILKRYHNNGGKLILLTLRTGKALDNAVNTCKIYGLEFDAVNDNLREQTTWWRSVNPGIEMSRKIYADMYIDDRDPRSLVYGIDWNLIEKMLKSTCTDKQEVVL